jgi:hypothetical protein
MLAINLRFAGLALLTSLLLPGNSCEPFPRTIYTEDLSGKGASFPSRFLERPDIIFFLFFIFFYFFCHCYHYFFYFSYFVFVVIVGGRDFVLLSVVSFKGKAPRISKVALPAAFYLKVHEYCRGLRRNVSRRKKPIT